MTPDTVPSFLDSPETISVKELLAARKVAAQFYVPLVGLRMVCEQKLFTDTQIVRNVDDLYRLLAPYFKDLAQEHLLVVPVNTKNRVLGLFPVYVGTVFQTTVRTCEIFRPAILTNATALFIAHNHPSGDPTPSPEDAAATRDMVRAGELLDIEVLDHLVIAGERYISLRSRGLGF